MRVRHGLTLAVALIVAVAVITAVIFANALKDIEASHQASGAVVDAIATDPSADNDALVVLVRKSAHLIEYAALGIAVMLLVICVDASYRKKLYGTACFYVLLVAVLDEYVQSLSDRTSSTEDILLDFLGALIGFSAVLAVRLVCGRLSSRKGKQ